MLRCFPYTILSQSFLLGFGSLTTALFSLPSTLSSVWNLCFCVSKFYLGLPCIYLARPERFFHAGHYCIPLHPYVSLRLICKLWYFTELGLMHFFIGFRGCRSTFLLPNKKSSREVQPLAALYPTPPGFTLSESDVVAITFR